MEEQGKHKVLVGFKCSPELRLSLCEQSEKVGVSLSSYVETIVASYKNKDNRIKELSGWIDNLQAKVEFYENSFLTELFDRFKGHNISYYNRERIQTAVTINDITDVYTVIINSFKIDK